MTTGPDAAPGRAPAAAGAPAADSVSVSVTELLVPEVRVTSLSLSLSNMILEVEHRRRLNSFNVNGQAPAYP